MSHVNLLPWREAQRQKQKQHYLIGLGLIAFTIFALFWLLGKFIDQQVRNQNSRNNYLTQQIGVLDSQIERIKDIKDSKIAIEQRMALISQLQVSRNVAPILFDELAKIVPPGVSFEKMSRSANKIELIGVSDSNNRLSAFMRQLDSSDVFLNAILSSIKADITSSNSVSDFKLAMQLSAKVAPIEVETDEAESGGSQ